MDMSEIDLYDVNSWVPVHTPRNLDFTYYKIKDKYSSVLEEILPTEYRSKLVKIFYVIVGGPHCYMPHRDKAGVCAINYYISTGHTETSFYELVNEQFAWANVDGVEFPGWYQYADVNKVASFSALAGESYILNISQIHDVNLLDDKKRHFIQYVFSEQL